MKRAALLWGPVLAWMGVIFATSSLSGSTVASAGPDWAGHAAIYLVLGALLYRALTGGRTGPIAGRPLLVAVVVATLYGVSDELHQSLVPGRDPSLRDVASDFAGAVVGAALYGWVVARGRGNASSPAAWSAGLRPGPASAGDRARSREKR